MPTVNERLLNRTVGHHIEVTRLAAGGVQMALDVLSEADREIFDVIHERATSTGQITPARIERLLTTVNGINSRAYVVIGREMRGQLNALAIHEAGFAVDLVEGAMPVDWTMRMPKRKFLRAIVDEEPMQGGLFNEWINGMAEGRFTRMRTQIRLGAQQLETSDQIITRLRGTRANRFRDGVLDQSRRSAKGILSSFYNHVANKARQTTYDENDDLILGSIWVSALDDTTCDYCWGLHGEFFEEGEVIPECPAHPNCQCDVSAIVAPWEELGYKAEEITDNVKLQLSGARPKVPTFDEWLGAQDTATQDDVLGKERGALFRRGIPAKRFFDHTGKRYTMAEFKRVEAARTTPRMRRSATSITSVAKMRNYGWTPDLPDQRDLLFGVENPTEIATPVRVSLRDKMPPVFDQGSLGSCTANAIIACTMFALGSETPMLSRLDLYYKERVLEDSVDEDSGAAIRDGIKALARYGVCTEATWPYKIRSFRGPPPKNADEEDDKYRIKRYERLKSHDDFQKCLTMGYPFVGGFSVYENFDGEAAGKKGILQTPTVTQKMVGGHAIAIVGYDTDFHNSPAFQASGLQTSQIPAFVYECRNSFGADWGDDGYFYMAAEYLENRDLSDDFWVVYA